jgi:hypothetical protein
VRPDFGLRRGVKDDGPVAVCLEIHANVKVLGGVVQMLDARGCANNRHFLFAIASTKVSNWALAFRLDIVENTS